MKELVVAREAPSVIGPYSPGLSIGEWILLSGHGGIDPKTGKVVGDGIAEQTEQTLRNIEVLLQAASASLSDVVSCLVHLADLADFASFNVVYARHFPDEIKPVRTTVRADLVSNMRVEVTAVAYRVR